MKIFINIIKCIIYFMGAYAGTSIMVDIYTVVSIPIAILFSILMLFIIVLLLIAGFHVLKELIEQINELL